MESLVLESKSEETLVPDGTMFITKLLGEMKSQFMSDAKDGKMTENEPVPVNTDTITDLKEVKSAEDNHSDLLPLEDVSSLKKITSLAKGEIVGNKFTVEEHILSAEGTKTEILNNESRDTEIINIEPEIPDIKSKTESNLSLKQKLDKKNINHELDSVSGATSIGRRSLRNKCSTVGEENVVKRTSRRRKSKETSESVLQSAIARKEKSYEAIPMPLRSHRQLKPTQKILENIAFAEAFAKEEKVKIEKSKSPPKNEVKFLESTVINEDKSPKVRGKRKLFGENKSPSKKNKPNGNIGSDEDILGTSPVRRSSRIVSSHGKDELGLDINEVGIPNTLDINFNDQVEIVRSEIISSRLCLCTKNTQLIPLHDEKDIIFCNALDNIDEKIIGCNRTVNQNATMLRPSFRVPYLSLCELHMNRMLRHNCCPTCGVFCTQGKFVQCEDKHQYHRNCQISIGDIDSCPHCAKPTPHTDVFFTMHSPTKPIFLNSQKVQYPSAKMTFDYNVANKSKCSTPPPVLNGVGLQPISPILNGVGLQPVEPVCGSDKLFDLNDLYEAVLAEDLEALSLIIASKTVNLSQEIAEVNDGTVLHLASQKGLLGPVHLLVVGGIDIDLFDSGQSTALMLAIMENQNDIVEYLIKAGADVSLKGTDGMCSLHLAAKCGNMHACESVFKAGSLTTRNFVNTQDDGGWTALVWACEHGFLLIAQFLISNGADCNLCDVEHNIALHWAAFSGSSSIMELLINNGSEVNTVNAHGDTPLHIAARENTYNCAIVLLARGADVSITNKNNETPIDCVPDRNDCYNLIALNVRLQALSDNDIRSKRILLTTDISNGKETNPIQCINKVDDEPKPTNFVYITKNCITSDKIQIDRKITTLHSCTCQARCVGEECACAKISTRSIYNEKGRLRENFNFKDSPLIFECNDLCGCNFITCTNRVVQKGVTQRFQLFRTVGKGWGIKTGCYISRGSYVCEYIGEILTDEEADVRDDDSYLFDLDNGGSESFCIDAKMYGNLARFINHSCKPNLTPNKVFVDHHDVRFPRIALFANRNILADEELSFDYGPKFWLVKYKSFTCQCETPECNYSEEKINETIEIFSRNQQALEDIS